VRQVGAAPQPSDDVGARKDVVELPKTLDAAPPAAPPAAPVVTAARDGGLDRGKTIPIDPTLLRMLGSDESSTAKRIHDDPLLGGAGGGKGPAPGDLPVAKPLPDAGLGGSTTGRRQP